MLERILKIEFLLNLSKQIQETKVSSKFGEIYLCDVFFKRLFLIRYEIHFVFYRRPVYKKLAFEWQIPKQFSGLNPLSLSNNKNYRLKKSGKSGIFPLQQT